MEVQSECDNYNYSAYSKVIIVLLTYLPDYRRILFHSLNKTTSRIARSP